MEAAQIPQVKKRLYHNNTAGWLGVVLLDHKGEEYGDNVEPGGDIWLSDAEAILTARAPRRAEDNPFEERTYVLQNPETGRREEHKFRPLTIVGDGERYVPTQDRYVPPQLNEAEGRVLSTAAAHGEEPGNVSHGSAVAERAAQVEQQGTEDRTAPVRPVSQAPAADVPPVPGPPSTGSPDPSQGAPPPPPAAPQAAAPVPPLRSDPATPTRATPQEGLAGMSGLESSGESAEEQPAPLYTEPEAPGRVLGGSLAGSDEPGPEAPQDDLTFAQPGDAVQARAQAAPQQPGADEEHAQAVDPSIGEETGQARPPQGAAAEGEFAFREEVGSPEAPERGDDEPLVGA